MEIISNPYINRKQAVTSISINFDNTYCAITSNEIFILDINKTITNSKNSNKILNSLVNEDSIQHNNNNNNISKEESVINDLKEENNIEINNNVANKEDENNNILSFKQEDKKTKDKEINEYILLTIAENTSPVNSCVFANNYYNYMISGGMEKLIIIYELDYNKKSYTSIKKLPLQSEINEIVILKDDKYSLCSSYDNNIYLLNLDFNNKKNFSLIFKLDNSNSLVNSIVVDPNLESINSFNTNKSINRRFITFNQNKKICMYEIDERLYNNGNKSATVKLLKEKKDYEINIAHNISINNSLVGDNTNNSIFKNNHNLNNSFYMNKISWSIDNQLAITGLKKLNSSNSIKINHVKILKVISNANSNTGKPEYLVEGNILVGHEQPIVLAVRYNIHININNFV